ncbi:zinc finger protein 705A-like [Choloepus didactylus]|uniref:zinc finger protein 705A-like n=1 Tax=Choloepus didactylus TaxID=27675 RepID=UPI00189C5C7C|nr:zinc finger protein 705A-like [Choloepus didactylus]
MKPVESVTFNDVTVNFTKEEWAMLDTNQRKMFRDVMLENINHLMFMGYQVCISEVLSQSEQGELWREGLRFLLVQSPGKENDHKKEEMITMQHISKDTSTNQTKISHTEEDNLESNDLGEYFTHSTKTDMGKKPNVNKQFQRVLNYHSLFGQNKKIQTGCKSYNCHLCGKVFRSSSGVIQLEKIHTGEKPYGYYLSWKNFTGSSTLRQHERIHTVENPYDCHLCGNSFSQSFNLRQHERIHNVEKLYACHRCGKDFSDSTTLRKCERTHAELKAYVCHVCGKDFTDSSTLRQHERTHTGEKPYVCSEGDSGSGNDGTLSKGIERYTGLHQTPRAAPMMVANWGLRNNSPSMLHICSGCCGCHLGSPCNPPSCLQCSCRECFFLFLCLENRRSLCTSATQSEASISTCLLLEVWSPVHHYGFEDTVARNMDSKDSSDVAMSANVEWKKGYP